MKYRGAQNVNGQENQDFSIHFVSTTSQKKAFLLNYWITNFCKKVKIENKSQKVFFVVLFRYLCMYIILFS